MTQEDKAKAYDEALKVLHKYDGAPIMFTQDLKEEMFPELAESEDEKIRKNIISWLKNMESQTIPIDEYNSAIAWLEKQKPSEEALEYLRKNHSPSEMSDFQAAMNIAVIKAFDEGKKQGEQTSFNDTQEYLKGVDRVQNYEELTKFEKGFDRIADTYSHNKNKEGYNQSWYTKERAAEMLHWAKEELGLLEKQGKHKPVEANCTNDKSKWSEEDEYTLKGIIEEIEANKATAANYEIKTYDRFLSLLKSLKDRVRPKQEWSEEDKAMINNLYQVIDGHIVISGDTRRMFCSWLESLKDRVLPQPKQEWSEEDLMAREEIINILQKCGMKKEENWLKSLRPQTTWKPSDEQMEALLYEVNAWDEDSVNGQNLRSLYQNLKTLKEE